MISTFLTMVIALHELGHMAAYRMFGHTSVRMIFIPSSAASPSAAGPTGRCSKSRPAR
jgi:hypothetical protein